MKFYSPYRQNWRFDPMQMPEPTKSVVFVYGTWWEMGYQFATQAEHAVRVKIVAGIAAAIAKYKNKQHALSCMQDYLDATKSGAPEMVELWDGIADALRLDRCDVYLAYLNYNEGDERCSNVCAYGSATKDGRTLFGLNCDEPETVNFYAPMVVAFPKDGYSFISASAFICNCFMNEKGLISAGSCGQWQDKGDQGRGMPNAIGLFLTAFQCADVNEAKNAVIKNGWGPASGENSHYADIGGHSCVIERTAQRIGIRTAGDFGETDYTVATNTFLTPQMQLSVFTGPRKWDNCLPRYWSEEQILKENFGVIDPDVINKAMRCRDFYIPKEWKYTKWETDVQGYQYGWNRQLWKTDPQLAARTVKWSPEIRTVRGKNVFSCVLDPSRREFYITNGCGDPLISMNAHATGNFCKILLDDSPYKMLEHAREYALQQVFWGARDLDVGDVTDYERRSALNRAKEAVFAGTNFQNLALCAQDEEEHWMLCGKAVSQFCKAQCYGQLAQDDPKKLSRDAERFELPW